MNNYIKDFLTEMSFDSELYIWWHEDLVDLAKEFITEYIACDVKDLKEYKENDCDFWNDKDANWHYFCDMSSEWADSQVDIYHNKLWTSAENYSWFTEEWLENTGGDLGDRGMIGALQWGQYTYFSQLANQVLNELREYIDWIDEIK